MARPARALWAGRDGLKPLLSLARLRCVGSDPGGSAERGGCPWRDRLGPALRGCDHHPRPSARRRRSPRRRYRGVRPRPGRRWAAARAASRPSCTCGPRATADRLRRCWPAAGGTSRMRLRHLRAEGNGRPITAVLTGGERHEQIALEALLDQGAIRRPGGGRPRLRPQRAAGDKGYSSPTARRRLRRRHIRAVIPSKSNQRRQPNFDRAAYRRRNLVERLINRLKQFRRIATRYEKRAANYLCMVHIGMLLLWL